MAKKITASILTTLVMLLPLASSGCDHQYAGRGDDPCKIFHCGKYRDKK